MPEFQDLCLRTKMGWQHKGGVLSLGFYMGLPSLISPLKAGTSTQAASATCVVAESTPQGAPCPGAQHRDKVQDSQSLISVPPGHSPLLHTCPSHPTQHPGALTLLFAPGAFVLG